MTEQTSPAPDDLPREVAQYCVEIVALLVGARSCAINAGEGTVSYRMSPQAFEHFDRLMGDVITGPIPGRPNIIERASAAEARCEALAEASKASLLALCCLLNHVREHMHPNMVKDVQFAIDANRAALKAMEAKSDG